MRHKAPADMLLRAVPGHALGCVHFPDLGRAWIRLGETVFGAFSRGLDLMDVSLRLRPLYEQLTQANEAPGSLPAPEWQSVEKILHSLNGEVILSLLDLDGVDATGPDVRALAGVTVHGAGAETSKLLDYFIGIAGRQRGVVVKKTGKVWAIRSSDAPYTFEIGSDGGVALFGIGEGTVAAAMNRLRGETKAFPMASKRCFKPDDVSRFHLNVGRLFETYSTALPAQVLQTLKAVRLDRVRGISGSVRFEKQNFAISMFYDSPGGHDMLTRFLAANPVDYTLLERIPKELASFSLFTFNPSWFLRILRNGLPPTQATALRDALTELKIPGLDVGEKVPSAFGPQCAQIGLPTVRRAKNGSEVVLQSLSNSAWLIQISNTNAVRGLLDQISEFTPARRRYRIGGNEAVTFDLGLPPLTGISIEPSIAVTSECLYIALSEYSLRRALKRGTAESAEAYRGLLRDVPNTVASVTYDGMKTPGMLGAALLSGMRRACTNSVRDPMTEKLNQLEVAMSNPTPTVAYTTADETGVFNHTISQTAGLSGMGGLTGMTIVASIAIPKLLKARSSANESAAIALLAKIRAAEERFRLQSLRDSDRDEVGEYGFLGNLMHPSRGDPLIPKIPGADGRYMKHGYIFRVFLPGRSGVPIGESRNSDEDVVANLAETFFVVAAWPVKKGTSGRRTFVMNTNGEIFYCSTGAYGGRLQPAPDILSFEPGNMVSRVLGDGVLARDGQRWRRVR